MERTLYYVPMIHRNWECGMGCPDVLDENDPSVILLDNYWECVGMQLFQRIKERELLTDQNTFDLHVFCESWDSRKRLAHLREILESKTHNDDPMHSIFDILQRYGSLFHVTESAWAYGAEGYVYRIFSSENDSISNFFVTWRDRAIARNLERYTPGGGTALLCVGSAHDVPAFLSSSWNIEVISAEEIVEITLNILKESKRRLTWADIYNRQKGERIRLTVDE